MFFRFLVLVFSIVLTTRASFAQKVRVTKVECRDVIRTKGGRVINCRIDAAFTSSVYFSTVPPMDTTERFLPLDSVQAIWPGTNRSRKLLLAKGGFPVRTEPVPAEYMKNFELPPWMKSRYFIVEAIYGWSRMFGVSGSPPNTAEMIERLRTSAQGIARVGYAGKRGFGAYVWADARANSTKNTQYKLSYRYVGGGAGLLYMRALSSEKDLGFSSFKAGLGYGTVQSRLSEIAQDDLTSRGGGVIFDLSVGVSFNLIQYVQLGVDLGAQFGKSNALIIEDQTKENLGRLYFGLKMGIRI